LIKDYGGYTNIIEQKGVNLSDVWDDVSPIRHAANKYRDANELPSAITDRVVRISGSPGGMFVDPFVGAGSALVSAVRRKMRFQACDLLPENCQVVVDRIDSFTESAQEPSLSEAQRAPSTG
jgi:site-specific DNA-methyltransferase (adenine-specific)